ncbi:MAG TPA: BA14K family protein [Mycoplana sp.]|nr:BA14K family protein [Mycoplana sp.]
MKTLAVIGLSLATAFSGVVQAQAFPSFHGPKLEVSDVQQVKSSKWWRHNGGGRHWSRNNGGGRHWSRNNGGGRHWSRNNGGGRHWNGGGRHWNNNNNWNNCCDDNDDDFGAVFGGLAAGALIGGLIAQPYYGSGYYGGYGGYYGSRYYGPGYGYYAPRYYAPRYYGASSHVGWCYSRYRSYRAYDNTFQPYYGPRRQCISPY